MGRVSKKNGGGRVSKRKTKQVKRVVPKSDPFFYRYKVEHKSVTGEPESEEFRENLETTLNAYGKNRWSVDSIDSLGNEKYLFVLSKLERRDRGSR